MAEFEKLRNVTSEILPPIEMGGRCRIIGINDYKNSREIEVSIHTIPVDEKFITVSERSKIEDYLVIKLKYEDLAWLAPKLEEMRKLIGIENGFDKATQ